MKLAEKFAEQMKSHFSIETTDEEAILFFALCPNKELGKTLLWGYLESRLILKLIGGTPYDSLQVVMQSLGDFLETENK